VLRSGVAPQHTNAIGRGADVRGNANLIGSGVDEERPRLEIIQPPDFFSVENRRPKSLKWGVHQTVGSRWLNTSQGVAKTRVAALQGGVRPVKKKDVDELRGGGRRGWGWGGGGGGGGGVGGGGGGWGGGCWGWGGCWGGGGGSGSEKSLCIEGGGV